MNSTFPASGFSQSQSHLSGSSQALSSTLAPFQLAPYAAVVAALPTSDNNLFPAL